jgi:hypothetical protein
MYVDRPFMLCSLNLLDGHTCLWFTRQNFIEIVGNKQKKCWERMLEIMGWGRDHCYVLCFC